MKLRQELVGQEWIDSRSKRRMDLIYSGALLPLLAPIGSGALLLSRVVDGEGSIFRQDRIGRNSSPLTIYKVRTLEKSGVLTLGNGPLDPRATQLGRKLRVLGLDEIPQFLNVFKGEMSLVGPRVATPVVMESMHQALSRTSFDEWQDMYYLSRPGLVSSFGLAARSPDFTDVCEEQKLLNRAASDVKDFRSASREYDRRLLSNYWKVMFRVVGEGLRSLNYTSSITDETFAEDKFSD